MTLLAYYKCRLGAIGMTRYIQIEASMIKHLSIPLQSISQSEIIISLSSQFLNTNCNYVSFLFKQVTNIKKQVAIFFPTYCAANC